MTRKLTRRRVLAGSATALAASGWISSAQSAPAAEKITPDLIEAAKKEGKVVWYTSVDLALGEKVAKLFEGKYPGVSVKVERSGAERNFQRIGQGEVENLDVGKRKLRHGVYRPLNAGLRFSMKARRPSLKSSLSKQASAIFSSFL